LGSSGSVELQVSGNAVLVDAGGIAALTGFGDSLHMLVYDNPELATLGPPWLAESLGGIVLLELPALTDIDALADLRQLASLEIGALHALPSLSALAQVERVGSWLSIGSCSVMDGNDALTSIDMPALTEVGTLWITGNDALTSLDGLSGVLVTDDVYIVDNVSLPTANAQAWSEMLPSHGAIEICGNADGVACDGGFCPIPE
jgi:hypothetical protein